MLRVLSLVLIGIWAGLAPAEARSRINIVGSSTVFPFTEVAIRGFQGQSDAQFVSNSTGTGGGFIKFCDGYGADQPDITGASRPMKASEFDKCAANGVTDIIELKIGHDGIVIASARTDSLVPFTRKALYLGLAAEVVQGAGVVANPFTNWAQIDPALPDQAITVYGPPGTSGTRDTLESLALSGGCKLQDGYDVIASGERKRVCKTMRGAPHFIEMTEDDLETLEALQTDAAGFGVFGYSYAYGNPSKATAHPVDGIEPDFDTIASGVYPLARPLFIYVKAQHMEIVPELTAFLNYYLSDEMIGPDGTLADFGLVPLTDAEIAESRGRLASRTAISRP